MSQENTQTYYSDEEREKERIRVLTIVHSVKMPQQLPRADQKSSGTRVPPQGYNCVRLPDGSYKMVRRNQLR